MSAHWPIKRRRDENRTWAGSRRYRYDYIQRNEKLKYADCTQLVLECSELPNGDYRLPTGVGKCAHMPTRRWRPSTGIGIWLRHCQVKAAKENSDRTDNVRYWLVLISNHIAHYFDATQFNYKLNLLTRFHHVKPHNADSLTQTHGTESNLMKMGLLWANLALQQIPIAYKNTYTYNQQEIKQIRHIY